MPTPESFGRYRVLSILGEGAMGTVYLAEDPQIERRVAVKTLRLDQAGGDPARERELEGRFLREAKIAGRLTHPHIISIFDVGSENKLPWIAMELVVGSTLSSRMRQGEDAFPLVERLRIVRDVALALSHAHAKDVVHRDIKPGNIMLTADGVVKVADFGIGKLLGGSTEMTRTGMMVGTPSYMSPEQVRGDAVTAASDTFSLGVVLYELMAGKRPFPADTITTLVYQILNVEPPDPVVERADLPPGIGPVLQKCLAKAPADRYARISDLAVDLDAVLVTLGAGASREAGATRILPSGEALPIPSMPSARSPADVPTNLLPTPPTAIPRPPTAVTAQTAAPSSGTAKWLWPVIALVAVAALVVGYFVRSPAPVPTDVDPTPTGAAAPLAPVAPSGSETQPAESQPPETAVTTPGSTEPTAQPATTAPPATAIAPPSTSSPAASSSPRPPTAAPAPSPAPTLAPPAPTVVAAPAADREPAPGAPTFVARGLFKIEISPDDARLTLDDRPIGLADDWDGSGGGGYLDPAPGWHVLRATLPGYAPLLVQLRVDPGSGSERMDVDVELVETGGDHDFESTDSPKGVTRGPVTLAVQPAETLVLVDGRRVGSAGEFRQKPLVLGGGPRVATIQLVPPDGDPETFRIVVSGSGKSMVEIEKEF